MRGQRSYVTYLGLVLACAGLAQASETVSMTVYDGGNFWLDGNVGPTTAVWADFVIGTPGAINQQPLWHVSKFKLDTILPGGTTSADIISATLSVPDMDLLRGGQPGIHPFSLEHFATTDDTIVVNEDGGYYMSPPSPALSIWKPVGGGRDPLEPDVTRVALVDVTASIKDDLDNGRALSSFRWGIGPDDAPFTTPEGGGDDYTFPDSDGVGTAFEYANMMRLSIVLTSPEDCTNGLDDDGDGLIDCEDPSCTDDPTCPEICDNSVDDDADGDIDCGDSECLCDPACAPFPPEDCGNGIDDDCDGDTDCNDSDCASVEPCVETICNDGLDGDNDGPIDCSDSDCFGQTGCTVEFLCEDGLDNDADGLTDSDDPDCATRVSMTVYDGGNFWLDGNVGPTTAVWADFVIGTPGAINQQPLWHVSKFKLDTILPGGTTSADIISATLSVPDMDLLRGGQPGIHPFSLEHFATTDDTIVVNEDGGYYMSPPSPALSIWKPVGGGRDPLEPDVTRVALVDVTASIKDDLDNGRALSSYRWGIGPDEAPATIGDWYTFPDSNGVGTAFEYANMMRLTVITPEPSALMLLGFGLVGLLRRRR